MLLDDEELRGVLIQKMRERGEASMKILREHVEEKFWKELRKLRMSDAALEKKIDNIMKKEKSVKRGLVEIEQKSKLGTPFKRGVQGYILKGRVRRARAKPSIPYNVRKSHTELLKQEVIRPWLAQLPDVHVDGVYFRGSKDPFKKDSKLLIESAPLFDDFRYHVCYEKDPFQLLETFRQNAGEYWSKRSDLWSVIKELLERIGTPTWSPDKVLEYTIYWATGKRDRDLLNAPLLSHTLSPSEISRRNEIVKQVVRRPPYSTKAREILSIVYELKSLRGEMKKVLEKHLYRSVPFPGECELLG